MPIPSDSKFILEIVYDCGMHDDRSVHQMVCKMTKLTMKQVSQWFRTKRWQDKKNGLPVPSRESPNTSGAFSLAKEGEWNSSNRKLLEICFEEGYCTLHNFPFLEQLTKLTKSQISNWVRQKKWRLRKQGIELPAEGKPLGNQTNRENEQKITRKRKRHDQVVLKDSKRARTNSETSHYFPEDPVILDLFRNAWENGCLSNSENYELVAALAGCTVDQLKSWVKFVQTY